MNISVEHPATFFRVEEETVWVKSLLRPINKNKEHYSYKLRLDKRTRLAGRVMAARRDMSCWQSCGS